MTRSKSCRTPRILFLDSRVNILLSKIAESFYKILLLDLCINLYYLITSG